jgi:hypothetical protein
MQRVFGGVLVTGVLSATVVAQAASISVPNGSFESPDGATPFTVSTAIDNWTTYGEAPFDTGGGPRSSATGVFRNVNPDSSLNFTNADQAQVAYIFSKSSLPGSRVGMEQILTPAFSAGRQYVLTLGVGLAGATPGPTEPLTFNLFYFDPANPSARTSIASRTIFNDAGASTGGQALSSTALTDLSVSTPVLLPGNVAVGKQIGVEIYTALNSDASAVAGRQYVLDNVRVTEVPEPASVAALAGGAGLLALRRSRRRAAC